MKGWMPGRVGRETLREGRDGGHAEASSLRRRGQAAGGLRKRPLIPCGQHLLQGARQRSGEKVARPQR